MTIRQPLGQATQYRAIRFVSGLLISDTMSCQYQACLVTPSIPVASLVTANLLLALTPKVPVLSLVTVSTHIPCVTQGSGRCFAFRERGFTRVPRFARIVRRHTMALRKLNAIEVREWPPRYRVVVEDRCSAAPGVDTPM